MAERSDPPLLPSTAAEARARELRRAAAVGQALSRARHDLNNLFHVATGWSRLLRDPRTGPEEMREGVSAVLAASASLSELIGGFLSLDGRASATPVLCDLALKLRELARGLEYLLPVRGRLAVELPEHALVLCNFSEVRSTLVEFVLDVLERSAGHTLRLALYDTDSTADGTAQVELVLEQAPNAAGEQPLEARVCLRFSAERSLPAPASSSAQAGQLTVLLVDAHRDVRRLATTMLERAGYQVLTAQDATEALETSRNYDGAIQILCCDASVSGLPAERLIAELLGARPELRVLVCSGEQRLGELDRYARLTKPFSYHQLITAVRSCHGHDFGVPR